MSFITIRRMLAWVLGTHVVILTDHDGSETVRLMRFRRNGQAFAARFGGGIHEVDLLDNGKIDYGRFVQSWRPLTPDECRRKPRRWPAFNTERVDA